MNKNDFHEEQIPGILQGSVLFKGVEIASIQSELNDSRVQAIEPGQVLLDPKHINTHIYILLHGELLVCLEPKITHPLLRLGVGDCVGELSIIDASAPSAYVVASVPTHLLVISKPVLWRMLAVQQVMALNLLHVLARRIRENNTVLLGSLELQRQYRSKAETDALTGLHNRAWFEEVFPKQLELCERTGQQVSLLMVDLDHFKKVNDTYGHTVGDEVLRHMGYLLRHNLRSTDLCARYGGEEMIVLMPGTELVHAHLTAERLRESVAATPLKLEDGRELEIHLSGGIAQWQPGVRLSDLIRSADQALYKAKDAGRNRIEMQALPPTIALC